MKRRDFIEKGLIAGLGTLFVGACSKKEDTATTAPKQVIKEPSKEVGQTTEPTVETAAKDETKNTAVKQVPKENVNYVKTSDMMAKNLKYAPDASKVPASIRIKRGDVAGADQNCKNCSFYTPQKGKAYGKCTLLPTGMVPEKAWCASWAVKLNVG